MRHQPALYPTYFQPSLSTHSSPSLQISCKNGPLNRSTAKKSSKLACALKYMRLFWTHEYGTHGYVEPHGKQITHDQSLTNKQLYALYLDKDNFDAVARKLYIDPSTSNSLVRSVLATQLQQAARDELLKTSDYIDVSDLEAEADNAFEALSTLLGDNQYFFDRRTPGLFDASVFAYTHLLLDKDMGWRHNRLSVLLRKYKNLVRHRDNLFEKFF